MSKKRCRRGHRNRSAGSVTRITVDVGHPNQVNPHRCQSPKLPQNVLFHETPRSQNHRSRVPNPSRASIAATQPIKHVKEWSNKLDKNWTNQPDIREWRRLTCAEIICVFVDSVIVCSVIVLCAQGMDLSRQRGFGGPPVGRFRPVKRAIDEGDIGRQEGEPRKAVPAGIRGKELIGNARWTNPLDGDGNTGFRKLSLPCYSMAAGKFRGLTCS